MNKIKFVSFTAGLVLATAFTLSCSDGNDGGDSGSSSSVGGLGGVSSSSDGGGGSSSSGGGSSSSGGSSSDGGSSSSGGSSSGGGGDPIITTFVDSRDRKEYKKVTIGTQTWMAENLSYNANNSRCGDRGGHSSDNTAICQTYGRLYDWSTAMALSQTCNSPDPTNTCAVSRKHKGICPNGWHIPSSEEWQTLVNFAGGNDVAGAKLKAKSDWNSYSGIENLDTYGFSALPGGYGLPQANNNFTSVGNYGHWWTANGYPNSTSSSASKRFMMHDANQARWDYQDKSNFLSVRCLED